MPYLFVVALVMSDGDEMVHHLLMDLAWKAVIVLAAVVVAITGMVLIWRRVGRPSSESRTDPGESQIR